MISEQLIGLFTKEFVIQLSKMYHNIRDKNGRFRAVELFTFPFVQLNGGDFDVDGNAATPKKKKKSTPKKVEDAIYSCEATAHTLYYDSVGVNSNEGFFSEED